MSSPIPPLFVRQERQDECLIWTINRPDRANAIGPTIATQLDQLLGKLETNLRAKKRAAARSRVLILRANTQMSTKDKIWIAGGDLKELVSLSTNQGLNYTKTMLNVCQRLEQLPLPVIAAIDGAAIGGGAELALAADIRIGTTAARFDLKQLQVGLATGFGGTRRLVNLLGKAQAQYLLLTTASLDARRCYELGLIHELVDDDTTLERRLTTLTKLFCTLDGNALAAQKQMLRQADGNTNPIDRAEQLKFKNLWGKHAHKAFLQKFLSSRS